jgi:hypothetical protein
MKKVVLNELFIYEGEIPSVSNIDNNIIKKNLFSDYSEFEIKKENTNKDIKTNVWQHITWVIDYVRDKFNLENKLTLVPINVFTNFHSKGETSLKRKNTDDYTSYSESPVFTLIYFVEGHDSDLIFEWKDTRQGKCIYTLKTKDYGFVIFNSNLEYYFTENKNNNYRIVLTVDFQVL